MLQGKFRSLAVLWAGAAAVAQAPLAPVTVCELVRDLPAREGKDLAVFGRYSFRSNGRWIDEQACSPAVDLPARLALIEDVKSAPKPPDNFVIDGAELRRKFAGIVRRTSLRKFRFGTPDYDRWAVIYGRIEQRHGETSLVIRGSGAIVFVSPD